MANRYWVGGTGTWNTSSTTNWSSTSGGSSGASVPTASDSVFFDQSSTYTVTMTGALTCDSFTVSAGTVTFATGTTPTLAVSGGLSITASTVWNSVGTITFNSATGGNTITTNGVTIDASITFTNGGAWYLGSNLTLSASTATRTVTLTDGDLYLQSYTFTCGSFSSSNANIRTLHFGTGKFVLNRNTTRTMWDTSNITNLIIGGTPLVESIGGGSGVTKTVSPGALPEYSVYVSRPISFSFLETTGTVTYTITANSTVYNLTFNGVQTISNTAVKLYGTFTHSTTNGATTFSGGTNAWTFAATGTTTPAVTSFTITPVATSTYDFPWTFDSGLASGGVTYTLAANLTVGTTRTTTLTQATLELSSYTLSTGAFSSNNTNNRTLDFGTGKIVLTRAATATIWNTTDVSSNSLSILGTPLVECRGGGAGVTKTILTGQPVESRTISFSLLETTGTATYVIGSGTTGAVAMIKNLVVNGSQTLANGSGTAGVYIYGSFTHTTTNGTTTFTAGSNVWTFSGTSGTYTITPVAAVTYDFPWTFSGGGSANSTFSVAANLTIGTTRTVTLESATLTLNNNTLTTGIFFANVGSRTINFGTGKIVLTRAATATIWTSSSTLVTSGTPLVECRGGGSGVTKIVDVDSMSEANAISFSFIETTGSATYQFATPSSIKNLSVNGVQTVANSAITIYGTFTHQTTSGTTTFSAGTGRWTFAATSGSYTITNIAGFTYDFPWTFDGIGGTWALAANLTLGSTRVFTLINGTFNLNNKTISSSGITVGSVSSLNGSVILTSTGGTPSLAETITILGDSTLTLNSNITTTADVILANGNLALSSYTLTVGGTFSSNNSNTRSLNCGTGKIVLNGATTQTIWNMTTASNFSLVGTSLVECRGGGTGVTKTINTGSVLAANAINFSLLETTGTATYVIANGTAGNNARINNLILDGSQTLANGSGTDGINIYGSFTHTTVNGTTTLTGGGNEWAILGASAVITPLAAFTYNFPWVFDSVGGTCTLAGNLIIGSTRSFTLTNGTFDLNNKTISGPTSGITVLTGSTTLTSTGGTPSLTVPFTHTSGTLSLGSDITTSGVYTHTAGTLNLNGRTLTLSTGYTTATGTKNLTFNGGTMVCSAASATAFNNAQPGSFTTTAGTGTGKISMTAATAKTFVGGGSTFNCTLSNDGAGALTVTGSNTFTTIANGVQPTTFRFTAGTTTTVTNWNVNGTSGNLVTINSPTTATHTLSKASGIVSSNYLSISYSTATGGASWYAGANSTNGGNNTGWIFSNPANSYPSFLMMFN